LHFHQELNSTRTTALERFASMPIRVRLTVAVRQHGVNEYTARDVCLAEVVRQLQVESIPRLTIESRQDDMDDIRTIARARTSEPTLVFDHKIGELEPMLWIADAVAWAFGAGGHWRRLVNPIIETAVELRP
jgi:hypothetical protein